MTTYMPQPGTTAFRALAHLQTLEHGAEVINAQLAERVGVPPSTLHACMVRSIEAGLVFSRQKGGHARSPTFWSLVDHSAAAVSDKPASLSPAAGNAAPVHRITPVRDSQHVVKAEPARADATDRETPAMRSPVGGPTGAGQPAAAGPIEASPITPQQGANRDASAGQSHVAGGSASPAGRGADGPTARGAAPVSTTEAVPPPVFSVRCQHGVRWEDRCPTCQPHTAPALADASIPGEVVVDPAPATTKRGLRVAAWSTGELAIEIAGGEVIVFGKPEADQVVAFCRRIGGGT